MTPDQKDTSVASAAVMGNFQLGAQLPNGKNFTVSGYLFDGESVESLNQRVDLLHDVLDRQRTRAEIPELEAIRDNKLKALGQQKAVLEELLAKSAAGEKLSSAQKQMITNMESSIIALTTDIDAGVAMIAQSKAKVGMT